MSLLPDEPSDRQITWFLCETTCLGSCDMTESYGMSISSLSAEVGFPLGRRGSSRRRGIDETWFRSLTTKERKPKTRKMLLRYSPSNSLAVIPNFEVVNPSDLTP